MIGVGDVRIGAAAFAFRLVVKLINSSRTRLDKALAVTPHPLPAD